MKKINRNLHPPEGYFFKDEDGVVHRDKNWTKVAIRLEAYRKRLGKPIGTPMQEVINQACARNPTLCFEEGARVALPKPPPSLKARVIMWLNGILKIHQKQKLAMVSPAEAEARGQICATCPLNTPMGVSSCSTCRQAVRTFRQELIPGRKKDRRLEGCGVLAIDLQTAVHLDEPRVDRGDLPAHCWRKVSQ